MMALALLACIATMAATVKKTHLKVLYVGGHSDIETFGNDNYDKAENAKSMLGAADVTTTSKVSKITPRNDLKDSDFTDLWLLCDYSDKHGTTSGGFCAIHMLNTLSTGGFSLQTGDKEKGQMSFEYTAHYSITAQDTVPCEVYIKAGEDEA